MRNSLLLFLIFFLVACFETSDARRSRREVDSNNLFLWVLNDRVDLLSRELKIDPTIANCFSNIHGSLLHLACEHGHLEMVDLLLSYAADSESRDARYGQTPLFRAVYRGHEDVVRLMLQKGRAKAHVADKKLGLTPLHLAAVRDFTGIVKLLLEDRNIEVDAKDVKYDTTPLHMAMSKGAFLSSLVLVEAGADLYSPAKGYLWGKTLPLETTMLTKEQKNQLLEAYEKRRMNEEKKRKRNPIVKKVQEIWGKMKKWKDRR